MASIRFFAFFTFIALKGMGLFAAYGWELPVGNLQTELSALEERFTTQEIIMEELRRLVEKSVETGKESSRQGLQFQEARLKKVEADLVQSQTTLIEAVKAINQYKDRILALEKAIDLQNKNISALKESLQLALEKDFEKGAGAYGQHVVSSGESLEKIAKKYQVSVQSLKELNSLSKETIFPGQKLKIPEKI